MSDYEHYKGTLSIIDVPEGTKLEQALWLKAQGYHLEDLDENDEYAWFYATGSDVVCINQKWYDKRDIKEQDGYEDVCTAVQQDDGAIFVEVKYYNGGTCFEEMCEQAVISLLNKK